MCWSCPRVNPNLLLDSEKRSRQRCTCTPIAAEHNQEEEVGCKGQQILSTELQIKS